MEKKILLIEDEPTINRIISKYFKQAGYTVLSALDGKKGLELFHKHKFDLICLDIMMPNINGWDVAKTIRETSHIPIIMISALSEEEDILKGYSLEVDDYITKPFPPAVLIAKIESIFKRIEIEQLDSEVLNINGISFKFSSFKDSQSIEELLTHDELTEVANRRFLDFYIEHLIKKYHDFHENFGVLFIDIDHFKYVNDTYGHMKGDVVLKELAQVIKTNLRNNDLVGRYGGEEFLVVLSVDNIKFLKAIAEKLRKAIEEFIFDREEHKLKITVSIGGTMFKDTDDFKFVSRADKYMYESKNTGRNKSTIK